MSKKIVKKVPTILGICAFIFALLAFSLFFIDRSFVISTSTNSLFASLFTLGFGGTWNYSSTGGASVLSYHGNAVTSLSFLFLCIVIVISGILLHDILRKKLSYKTNISLASVSFALLLFTAIGLCFTRRLAALTYVSSTQAAKLENIIKITSITPITIISIVSSFLSCLCFAGYITHTAISQKKSK